MVSDAFWWLSVAIDFGAGASEYACWQEDGSCAGLIVSAASDVEIDWRSGDDFYVMVSPQGMAFCRRTSDVGGQPVTI